MTSKKRIKDEIQLAVHGKEKAVITLGSDRALCIVYSGKVRSRVRGELREVEDINRILSCAHSRGGYFSGDTVKERIYKIRRLLFWRGLAISTLKDLAISYHYMRFKGE